MALVPKPQVADAWNDASATERGLADSRGPRHEHERVASKPLENGPNFRVSPEEEGAVLGLERSQTAVGIAFRQSDVAALRGQCLQRLAQLFPGGVAKTGVLIQAALNDRRQ